MKANEFVKKFGWKHTKALYANAYQTATHARADYEYFKKDDGEWFVFEDDFNLFVETPNLRDLISLEDLKRLVESKSWVDEHVTIERAKDYANSPYTAPEIKERLLQAIADVESCL